MLLEESTKKAPVRQEPAKTRKKRVLALLAERYALTCLIILAGVAALGIFNWEPNIPSHSIFPSRGASGVRLPPIKRAPIPPALDGALVEHARGVLTSIQSNINPDTRLAYSFTGDKRLQYWSVVYDNCIRALAHLRTGRPDLAKKTIDYFIENTAIQKIGWVNKNGRLRRRPGWIVNIVDASEDRAGGRGIEHIAHTGPNVYLGITGIHIYHQTGDKKYLEFARKQWDLIKDLQNERPDDPNYGGVRMGPMGNPENSREQKLDFKPGNPSFYQFYNGEHAADFKGFSDLMAQLDPERAERYTHASKLIEIWDHKIYDADKHLFFIGTTEKRYYDPNIGQWIEVGVIPMYPLDTSSLKLSAYGVDGLEQFEPGAAVKIRQAIDRHFKVTIDIKGADGKPVQVTGYDFVGSEDRARLIRLIEMGPYGDKKIRKGIGRKPLLTDEWSNWVALADLRLADDFAKKGDRRNETIYLNSYYENAVVNGLKTAVKVPGGVAYPYSHPLPDSLNQPVGFGWNTHHVPYATIGGAARLLGLLRFDPFRVNGGDRSLTADIQISPLGKGTGKQYDSSILYTEAELYLHDAWRDIRIAQVNGPGAEKYWRRALAQAERMLNEHKDWTDVAKKQNLKLSRSREKYPLQGVANLTVRDLEPVYRRYWALYHIGTAEFIVVMANASLRDLAREKGREDAALAHNKKAIAAAKRIKNDYTYAQSFDENGWLWQPAQALSEYVDVL